MLGLKMEIQNKKEENMLQTAISPAASYIFVGGAVNNIGEKFRLYMNNEK